MRLIDRIIFGNGRGMDIPVFDSAIYWLLDAHTGKGDFYQWSGWNGCQLQSFQWTHPKAQENRLLLGFSMRAHSSKRQWGRVRVTWTLIGAPPEELREHIKRKFV